MVSRAVAQSERGGRIPTTGGHLQTDTTHHKGHSDNNARINGRREATCIPRETGNRAGTQVRVIGMDDAVSSPSGGSRSGTARCERGRPRSTRICQRVSQGKNPVRDGKTPSTWIPWSDVGTASRSIHRTAPCAIPEKSNKATPGRLTDVGVRSVKDPYSRWLAYYHADQSRRMLNSLRRVSSIPPRPVRHRWWSHILRLLI